jgi:hypothetical protein
MGNPEGGRMATSDTSTTPEKKREDIPWNFIERIAQSQDHESIIEIHRLAVQLSRAVALSAVVAISGERVEDEAIAAADRAWVELVDDLMLFFVGKGIGHEGN